MKLNFYLFFRGDCFEAMTLYAEALGGTVESVFRNKDVAAPEDRMPGGEDLVMNMSVRIGDMRMMGSDNSDDMYQTPQGFRVQIEAPSLGHFEQLHGALGKGARRVDMPPGETFWAERFAMFTDRFGTPWMLNFTGSKAP
ncbi:MAG: glyoxalase/bleomycin resistance/extradiol dioxygenase family protein [Alphaproteobacteria bacterium]|nr:glyoxalase/bleomycin resistance/extradiol dioxygenase family protein [Alphaproteobacteria bacterium]